MGNGLANIFAALIVAFAILWSGGFGDGRNNGSDSSDDQFNEWYARAVGDIRNDIVVNCGCCGDEQGERRAASSSF